MKLQPIGLKITVFSLLFFLIASCGHKKKPTGGPKDTVNPKILATNPPEFSKIGTSLEILFSKPIDKTSIYTGISIYPPILKKKYIWNDNLLIIKINEPPQDSINYIFKFSTLIQDIHQNSLDKSYDFVFSTDTLQNYSIYGKFIYEEPEDKKKKINLSLFSQDSILVLQKFIENDYYKIEYLNPGRYYIKAFIDKNSNGKYDFAKEPFGKISIADSNRTDANIFLTYQDTIAPYLKSVHSMFKNQLTVKFSEKIKSIGKMKIFSSDSLHIPVKITDYKLYQDSLIIISSRSDSLKYIFKLTDIEDKKNNVTPLDSIYFNFSAFVDTIPPTITRISPENGVVIKSENPQISLEFSELIKKISLNLTNNETKKSIKLKLIKNKKDNFVYKPSQKLKNYSSYTISVNFEDYNLNKSFFESQFIIMGSKNGQ